jgi:NAD(P)-dependent dehydrogenase (short-subunit alcohol dehydrogenase family)
MLSSLYCEDQMDKELAGKTALITGASRGIGAATALTLARNGVSRFLLHYNSNRAGIEQTLAAVRAEGAQAEAIGAELGQAAGIREFVKQIDAPIDILVNNAGSLVKRAKLLEFTEELFDYVVNLNVKSAWMITQAVAPSMIARGGGVVVNLSSIAARNGGGPGATIYAAAKAMVATITKGLAKELAPQGIRVNAVSPGTVDNYFHEQFSTRQMLDSVATQTPAGTLGTNEEIADTILFLCSHGGRFIHGQTIEVNGGLYMV